MTESHSSFESARGSLLLIALFAAAGALSGCQPGTLPCDSSEEWRMACAGSPGVTTGGGGSGGTSPTPTGGMGGMGGSTPTNVNASTAVMNCPAFPNLGDMDKFFAMRCGQGATCHLPTFAAAWNDLKTPEIWKRMPTLKSVGACAGKPLIDTANPTKSVLFQKTQMGGKCPDDKAVVGDRMPSMNPMLTAAESTCLEEYLKALK